MAFSESLGLGNTTFLNLEKHALKEHNNHEEEGKETSKKVDNFTELFDDDFTYNSLSAINDKKDSKIKLKEESMVHVSQLKTALNIIDKENCSGGNPTYDGDMGIIENEISELSICEDHDDDDDGCGVKKDEAEDINCDLNVPIFTHNSLSLSKWKENETEIDDDEEIVQHLNESVFSHPMRDIMELEGLTAQLEESKRQLKESLSLLESTQHQESCKKSNVTHLNKSILKDKQNSSTTHQLETNSEALKHISAWNLPPSILNEYEKKGVIKMFDWQIECLSNPKVLFDHRNLVYSAPTSAGKTLVSEILLLKTVLERSKKALLILPFISVVREKMHYLQDLLTPAGYRVEGFYGGYTPPGGFEKIHVAICTIEKANSIINKLLEQGHLEEIGTIIVDEVHLISDPGRGYILELLLAKVLYMSRKYGFEIQIITMSATLANVELLKRWLDSELFITNFRPVALQEMIKLGSKLYDNNMQYLRDITAPLKGYQDPLPQFTNDSDHVAHLCMETLLEGCSVIVFCPSKDWCENLAIQLAGTIHSLGKSGSVFTPKLREQINRKAIDEVKRQLKDIPTGLDSVLEKTITYACAFHHAGLTTEERDIIEQSFKRNVLKIIVATSTLSCGVNLPARRVIIRSPLFGGKQMSSLTYRQMIGRAGRTGKDTLGESILICSESNARIGRALISDHLKPLTSCLEADSSTHLKRALLEVISSGIANTKEEVENFVNCTLLSVQKQISREEKDTSVEQHNECINQALNFLLEYEFIRLQVDEESNTEKYTATRLGSACLASSMPPTDGLILFTELQKSRRCFVLESELHAVYLVTPFSVCYQLQELDWLLFLDLWEKLTPAMKKVGELVGVKESFLVRAMRGQTQLDYKLMQIHKRFYTALALQELVNETPINVVSQKYKCTRGHLQGLQQMASTFAGIVTAFCNSLRWNTLALVVSQFKERLFFGVHSDLIDLMRLPDLNQKRARSIFDAGITSLVELANSDALAIEKILHDSMSFDSAKQQENEDAFEADKRNKARNVFITGKPELSVSDAAKMLIADARTFVQYEIGAGNINWSQQKNETPLSHDSVMHMSCEEKEQNLKRRSDEALFSTTQKQIKMESSSTEIVKNSVDTTEKPKDVVVNKLVNDARKLSTKSIKSDDSLDSPKPSTSKEAMLRSKRKQALELKKRKLEEKQLLEAKKESTMKTHLKNDHLGNGSLNEVKEVEKTPVIVSKNLKTPKANKYDTPKVEKPQDSIKKPLLGNKLRRSPRNHNSSVKTSEPRKFVKAEDISLGSSNRSKDIEAVFQNDNESFEFNSSLDAVLKLEEHQKQGRDSLGDDEIPNSQNLESDVIASPANSTASRHISRFMRSYRTQRPVSPKLSLKVSNENNSKITTDRAPTPRQKSNDSGKASKETLVTGSSIELSDLSLEDSLIKNPIQLNASHIFSCSKQDTDSSSFKSIDIIDICGNEQLFKEAFKELHSAKRFGFSIGVEKLTSKRKPLIGANLLINQDVESDKNTTESPLFQIDDNCFLSCVSFCISENVVFYMNMQDKDSEGASCSKVTSEHKSKYLRIIFDSIKNTFIMYDAKDQLKTLTKASKNLTNIAANIEDPKIANWLLQPDHFLNLKQMAQQFAPECAALAGLCGSGRGYTSYGLDANSAIFAKIRSSVEACISVHILKGQIENLERIGTGQLYKFFKELEMPLQLSLMQMELFGFAVNEEDLRKLFQKMVETMKKLENKIYELHGSKFNLGSTTAVGRVLGLHRKANGRICTSRQILEKIDSPISQLIIAYRKLSATLSKNVQPLMQCVENGRIHGQSLTCTATGRISMVEPNLQNVAKDFEVDFGKEKVLISCRSVFYPSNPKRCLISADFCQLEMRILAHLSQDPFLLQVMNSESDIFMAIAARWNKIPETKVTEQLRNGTKQICYGIIYGMGMRALAESLKCTDQEALMISDQFHATYPGIRAYAEKVVKFARNTGYIETITGRRRHLENMNSVEAHLKNQAERQALNSAIQGSAADIAKSAILRIEKHLIKYREKFGISETSSKSTTTNAIKFVLHLHDELLFEVPEDKAKKIAKVISITMQNCVKLNVPLKVKLRIGKNWGELREVKV